MGFLIASIPRMRLRETARTLDKHFNIALKDM